MNHKNQKVIAFDLDQTLFNHELGESRGLRVIYDKFFKNCEINYIIFEDNFHGFNKHIWELFEKGDLLIAEAIKLRFIYLSKLYNLEHISNEVYDVYTENYIQGCIPFKNVNILLTKLLDCGYSLAVCSNGMKYIQDSKLTYHNLKKYFTYYHYGTKAPFCKPNFQFFEVFLDSIQKLAQDVMFIGDSMYYDIIPAKSIGMKYLHFNSIYLDKRGIKLAVTINAYKANTLVLKNITYYSKTHEFKQADIKVKNGKIFEISPVNSDININDIIIDSEKLVIFPGIINAHLHPSKELYLGFADYGSISEILDAVHKNNRLETDPMQQIASLYSIAKNISQGVTTIGIFTSRAENDILQTKITGARAIIHFAQNDQWIGKETKPCMASIDSIVHKYLNLAQKYDSETISVHPATASELSASKDLIKNLYLLAKDQHKKFALHVSEGDHQVLQCVQHYGISGIELLNSIIGLDNNLLLIHATSLSQQDLDLIYKTSINFVHCPVSNSFTGAGKFPITKLLGHNIGMGTDAAMVNPFNRLSFDAAFSLYFHGESDLANKVSAKDIIDALTIKGALSLGIKDLGAIEEGSYADFCYFDKKNIFIESQNPSLVFLEKILTNNPKHVMINGKFIIYDNSFIDLNFMEIEESFMRNRMKV